METLKERFGLEPGDEVPLHIANQIRREQEARRRDANKAAAKAAADAVEGALSSGGGEEKPRSGRRPRKNIRPPNAD